MAEGILAKLELYRSESCEKAHILKYIWSIFLISLGQGWLVSSYQALGAMLFRRSLRGILATQPYEYSLTEVLLMFASRSENSVYWITLLPSLKEEGKLVLSSD